MAFIHSAKQVRKVAFLAWSGAGSSRSASGDVLQEVLLTKRKACRDTVQHYSKLRTVRFSKD